MKKLTAGIFATLLAVVSADSAYAAIASKGYVDEQVGTKADASTVTSLQGTVSGHTSQIGTINATIGGYGDIVTHDASEFATAAQGSKADTAVQPADITNVERTTNKTQTVNAQSTEAQYPSAKAVWTAVSSVDANASVEALEGRVGKLETASATHATKTELTQGLAAKANSADLGALAKLNAVGSGQITDGAVATADIADKAVTEAKLSDTVNASLDKADTALQDADLAPYQTKVAADAAYAVKALEDQVGDVSATNMGTTATTVVTAIKEVAGEADAAASAASAADTKAGQAQTAATKAQGEVDALEGVVNHESTGLAAAHTAIDALESGKLDKTATAARATADASGNVITDTYATKAEIADMATDENLKLKQDKTDNSLATTNKTVVGAINEVRGTANTASSTATAAQSAAAAAQEDATQALADAETAQEAAEAAQTAANSKLPTSTYNTQVGTVSATNMGTTATTVVTAIKEVAGEAAAAASAASTADTKAGQAQTAAEAAQETADAAIPKPAGECSNPANKCVLTWNNSAYAWEVIERGDAE